MHFIPLMDRRQVKYTRQVSLHPPDFRAIIGTAISGSPLLSVIPKLSVMEMSARAVPSGSFQSKDLSRLARMRCTILDASGSPGHIRRPAPKGINSMWFPLKSTSPVNLSGRKTSASEPQAEGVRPMAQALINILDSAGMVY